MGQTLSRPDWEPDWEPEPAPVPEQDQEQDLEPVPEQDQEHCNEQTNEVVGRQEHKCQICNSIDPYQITSLCESCQLSICQQCESPNSNYIVCESCCHDLYRHDNTLIECEYCGNLWDGHAQCNCYYEDDDM